jgi:hypothetical protein
MTRHPVATVIMVVFGVILLLPGLCAVFLIAIGSDIEIEMVVLWAICFLIAAGGVWLLVAAFR